MTFTKASTIQTTDSIFNSVWAQVKAGKTTYAIGRVGTPAISHWPLPLYALNYDMRMAELLPFCDPAARDAIFIKDLAGDNAFQGLDNARRMLEEAEEAIAEALREIQKANQGTIVFDTATAHWDIIRKVKLAKVIDKRESQDKSLYPFDYAPATDYWRHLIAQLRSVSAANVLMIHHAQEIYDGQGKPTGYFRPQDSSQQQKLTQVQMLLLKRDSPDGGKVHEAKIEICGLNTALEGIQMPTHMLDYKGLYRMIHGKDSPYV